MDGPWTFEGQVCIDGFNCQAQLQEYLSRNGGVAKIKFYGGAKVVIVVSPVESAIDKEVPF